MEQVLSELQRSVEDKISRIQAQMEAAVESKAKVICLVLDDNQTCCKFCRIYEMLY